MFTHAFCDSEPMTHYIDMQYNEFRPFAALVVNKAIRDKLSTVVVENNEVIACALAEDITAPLEIPYKLTPKFDPIFHVLENLSTAYFTENKPQPNQITHLFITAVHHLHRGKGLSEIVNFGAMDLAAERGFQCMTSELTNFINEKGIIKHLPTAKKLIGSIIYKDYVFNNTRPFANLEGGANSYIWALKNGIKIL